jgi:hypothetical protein
MSVRKRSSISYTRPSMVRKFGGRCEDLEDDSRTEEPSNAEIRKRLPSLHKASQRTMNDTKW